MTRDAEAVLRACGIERLSSAQVSRAASLLDAEAEAWRTRPPGEVQYLIPEAGDGTMRHGGMMRDAAVLSAIGTGQDEQRVPGVCMALSEAGVHWLGFPGLGFPGRGLLDGLVARGLRGVAFITPDDHAELHAVRNAGTLAGAEAALARAEAALAERVASWRDSAPKRAKWPEQNVPEGLAVFTRPAPHRRRLFT